MLGRRQMTVKRYIGSYVNGRWSNNTEVTEFTIEASVHSVSENELEPLDQGRRSQTILKLITDTELFAANPLQGVNSDIVSLYDNELYEVIGVSRWQNGIIDHYSILIAKAQQ